MSLLPQQTNINMDTYFFLRGTGQSLNVSSLTANNISTNTLQANSMLVSSLSTVSIDAEYINNSTINTLHLDLDGQIVTANATDLLLNGVPIATTANISSIADWSYDPAVSTVQMAGNDLNAAGTVSSINIRGGNAFFTNLMAINSMFVSTYTSTISTLVNTAELGNYSTLNAGNIYTSMLDVSSCRISTLNTSNIYTNMLDVSGGYISTPALYVSSINGSEFNSTGIVVQVAGVSSLVANSISSIGAELRTALVSTLQFNPSFSPNLDVNLGLGSLFGNLAGAAAGGIGVLVGAAGLGTGIAALAQGRQTNYINSNVYETVNGTTQLQISTLGAATSTIFRANSGVPADVTPGAEVFISSILPAGTVAIRSVSDPLNTVSTPNSTIQSFGQWVALPDVPVASTISSFQTLYTSSLTASTIAFPNDTLFRQGSSFGGTGGVSTLELYWAGSVPPLDATLRVGDLLLSGSDVGGLNYSKDVIIQNLNNGQRLGVYGAGIPGFSTIAFLSDIPQQLSTFRTFGVSSLTGSTISALSGNFNNLAGYTTSPISVLSGLDATGQLIISDGARTNNLVVSTIQNQGPVVSEIAFGGVAGNTLTLTSPNLVITNPIPSVVISTATISSVNGGIPYTTAFPPSQTDTFSTIKVSTIKDQTSSILIQNADLASLSFNTAGDIIGVATNYISWQAQGPGVLVGATYNGGPAGNSSNYATNRYDIAASTINMSTNQLAVRNISTTAASLSSLTINSGSSVSTGTIFMTAAGGAQSQPPQRFRATADIDLGNANDIWTRNIRMGAGNTGTGPELVFYDSANQQAFLNWNLQDRAIRTSIQSLNLANYGYLLDTYVNPPFFSTINAGTSTALISYFPSTLTSTIGYSTLSVMPPLTYIASVYDSTTQAVAAANTATNTKWNTTAINKGGFTIGTSTITVPVAGTYELGASFQFATTSGGTNKAQFWPTKNGTALPQTNSIVSIVNNGDTLGNITLLDTAAAGDQYGLQFYSSDNNMSATATAAGATPAVPSIIFSAKRIG